MGDERAAAPLASSTIEPFGPAHGLRVAHHPFPTTPRACAARLCTSFFFPSNTAPFNSAIANIVFFFFVPNAKKSSSPNARGPESPVERHVAVSVRPGHGSVEFVRPGSERAESVRPGYGCAESVRPRGRGAGRAVQARCVAYGHDDVSLRRRLRPSIARIRCFFLHLAQRVSYIAIARVKCVISAKNSM